MTMQDTAREYFCQMIRECGEDIAKMRSSFEMYIQQYLQDFPDERQLLVDALKVGIAEKIIQHAGEPKFGEYLEKLVPRFAEAAQRGMDEAQWAVTTWSIALNRTADYVKEPVIDRFYADDHIDIAKVQSKEAVAQTAMTVIVTAGGILGAVIAAMIFPLAMYAAGFSDDFHTGGSTTNQYRGPDATTVFLVIGVIAGSVSGTAAFCGWWLGKGAEDPWASFGVACGTAFTMFMIVMFAPFGTIAKPIVLFCSVFGATYKSAARGGYY
jgi:hypothetical protein